MTTVDPAELASWDAAYGYGHVTPRGWLYGRLLATRDAVAAGSPVAVADGAGTVLRTPADLHAWVRERYPEFADDTLHPAFRDTAPPAR